MKLRLTKILLTISISTFLFSCNGQVNTEKKSTTSNELLIEKNKPALDNKIWVIYQDSNEQYWFGSNGNGIYHFDGEKIKQFTEENGLVSNQIRGIQENKAGSIFIETPEGISVFDGTSFTTLQPIISENNEWKLEPNDLWFSCNGNANDVFRFDGNNLYQLELPRKDLDKNFGIDTSKLPYNAYSIFGIDRDKDGNIWFGTVLAGAYRYDGKSFLWVNEKELSRQKDGREPGVRSIVEDKNDNIWMGNLSSNYRIRNNKYVKKRIDASIPLKNGQTQFFNSGLSDMDGNLWMTTYSNGVWRYDGKELSRYIIKNSSEQVMLISIYEDKNGTIWLGTDNDGVYRMNGDEFEKFDPKT
ncbi:hypothetical protein FJ651_00175 [Paucihalobacter ruber]|uniref:Two component regulator propeller n=1 Tax=Paucihalobacter ruber TaxID=2567861 RepID=A0A506PNB6_9FLAO|nr:two-component regulator propeller domain-containing protein [Paucihalobacter ruber]TPV35373.1 hypothetical protein FJ651_00175 [Paucihalobacter ruber]